MQPIVLNRNYEKQGYLGTFKSLEWVRRYHELGDFVLNVVASEKMLSLLNPDNLLIREDDDMVLTIESIMLLESSNGDTLEVKGTSIEKILDRRIVWNQTNSRSSETAEDFIRRIVDENCINPSDQARKMPDLILGERKGFTEKIDKQVTGDSVLKVVSEICIAYGYGFKITLNDSKKLVFELYKGTDRSYEQSENPVVEFSPSFGNLIESEYIFDKSNYRNIALVGGEGEGTERKYHTVGNNAVTGLDRYEMFVDARDISTNNGEIADSEYLLLLAEKGYEVLAENSYTESFEGSVETKRLYIYKEHYQMCDIIQTKNKYGISATARIVGIIESENKNGYHVVPTFSTWEV